MGKTILEVSTECKIANFIANFITNHICDA